MFIGFYWLAFVLNWTLYFSEIVAKMAKTLKNKKDEEDSDSEEGEIKDD